MPINLFGDEQKEVSIWDNVEDYKGNHEALATLFADGMKKEYGFVSNNKHVVARTYNPKQDKVVFLVFNRISFYNYDLNNIKNMLSQKLDS
jgi:hypothetical protein